MREWKTVKMWGYSQEEQGAKLKPVSSCSLSQMKEKAPPHANLTLNPALEMEEFKVA